MKAIAVCAAIALVLVVSTLSSAEPTISISTDRSSYAVGDTVYVSVGVQNQTESTSVDLCIGLLMPDGAIYTMGPTGWASSITPWAAGLWMPGSFGLTAEFEFDLPSVLPSPPIAQDGDYYFAVLCLDPVTWGWASNLGLAPFNYSSGAPSIHMVSIPDGSFVMGSPESEAGRLYDEGPQRTVNVSAFKIADKEITQKKWEEIMGWNDCSFRGDDLPVHRVSWFDCVEFCNRLSQAEGRTPCYSMTISSYDGNHISSADVNWNPNANGYRLPTEVEWEYACRAGSTTRFYGGDSDADLNAIGWFYGNSDSTIHQGGVKAANAFGLYDMSGNVWEWCWDWHDSGYYGTRPNPDSNPTGPDDGTLRVFRGGCFIDYAASCRSAERNGTNPGSVDSGIGFRVAMTTE
ncbi:MAG: formylglycine-generating enzyme family protein [Candidatus Coatesbacteria bacterium]|nr:formylglycine-generating enzyme family protein [Candidatus Coatesbacteria bacterium]